jgi:hypothetical protein
MPNEILGFGQQPAGISAGGLGTPLGLPSPGSTYESVADLTPARSLDLSIQDYAVDTDTTGAPHGVWDPLLQGVVLRLTTKKKRLAYAQTFGNGFFNLDRTPADIQADARLWAEDALHDLIEQGLVRIESVEAAADRGVAAEVVTWIDVAKNEERVTRLR